MAHPAINVVGFDKGYVVAPKGRIGGPEGETLEAEFERLAGLKPEVLVVDMAGVEMLSSRAISAMIRLHRLMKETGGKARLAAIPPAIHNLLKSVKLDDYIPVYMTVDQAKH